MGWLPADISTFAFHLKTLSIPAKAFLTHAWLTPLVPDRIRILTRTGERAYHRHLAGLLQARLRLVPQTQISITKRMKRTVMRKTFEQLFEALSDHAQDVSFQVQFWDGVKKSYGIGEPQFILTIDHKAARQNMCSKAGRWASAKSIWQEIFRSRAISHNCSASERTPHSSICLSG